MYIEIHYDKLIVKYIMTITYFVPITYKIKNNTLQSHNKYKWSMI